MEVNEGKGNRRKLRLVAKQMVIEAIAGNVTAQTAIRDTLDGKPAQTIVGDPERPIEHAHSLDTLELARRIVYQLDLAQRQPRQLEVLDVESESVTQGESGT